MNQEFFAYFFQRRRALLLVCFVSGCLRQHPPVSPAVVASPHYVLGGPYEVAGHWYYPAESFSLDETGIAAVEGRSIGLTADGELRDRTALTGAMQTLQLPAIVAVTNLENGRQVTIRVNDRGPASPGRIVALSPRAALFLQIPAGGAARVRVRVDDVLSHRVEDQLGGGPKLAIATAPSAVIAEEALPAPGGGAAGPARMIGGAAPEAVPARVPDRMPEAIRLVPVAAGSLYLRCGSFGRFAYAHSVAAQLSGLGADVQQSRDGRQSVFAVRAGPFATIGQADRALDEALRAGVVDAHITVE